MHHLAVALSPDSCFGSAGTPVPSLALLNRPLELPTLPSSMSLPQWALEGFPGLCIRVLAARELAVRMGKPSHPEAHRSKSQDRVPSQGISCRIPWAQVQASVWLFPCRVPGRVASYSHEKVPGALIALSPRSRLSRCLLPREECVLGLEEDRTTATTQSVNPIKSQVHEQEGFLA